MPLASAPPLSKRRDSHELAADRCKGLSALYRDALSLPRFSGFVQLGTGALELLCERPYIPVALDRLAALRTKGAHVLLELSDPLIATPVGAPQRAGLLFENVRDATGRQEVGGSHRAEYAILDARPCLGVQTREIPQRDGEDLPEDGARYVIDPRKGSIA